MTCTVSVLLPSRGRPDMLRDSIESLGKGDYEVLVRYDGDDKTMPLKGLGRHVRQIAGERVGYKGFHLMINELASQAEGEWLLLWNDDAVMQSDNWLLELQRYDSSKPCVLNFFDPGNPQNNLFPLMSKAMFEAIGHFSLSTHCDTWALDIANATGTHIAMEGISSRHVREDIDDLTKRETQSVYADSSPEYFSDDMRKLREQDIERIRRIL